VYRRADLWRTFVLVVALLLTAISTGAFVRESRRFGAETAALEQIRTGTTDPDRTNVALIGTMTPVLIRRHLRTERT
jgi:hypothetical protein